MTDGGANADRVGDGGDVDSVEDPVGGTTGRRTTDGIAEADADYRRGTVALGLLGAVSLAGAVFLPDERTVLLALAGIGLFGAVLLRYLSRGRFAAATGAESVYGAFAATGEALVRELELRNERFYAPTGFDDARDPVRLYVPARPGDGGPVPEEVRTLFVEDAAGGTAGIALSPTGVGLYRAFREEMSSAVADAPEPLAEQVSEALVSRFELVESADPTLEPDGVVFEVAGSAYGPVTRFDHPVASFAATTMAATLDVPVRVEVSPAHETGTHLVTLTWGRSVEG